MPATAVYRPSNFNSRPREGGDAVGVKLLLHLLISIRAPARGATQG